MLAIWRSDQINCNIVFGIRFGWAGLAHSKFKWFVMIEWNRDFDVFREGDARRKKWICVCFNASAGNGESEKDDKLFSIISEVKFAAYCLYVFRYVSTNRINSQSRRGNMGWVWRDFWGVEI